MDYETIKVEIDDDVYEQVQQILAINNLTMEQAVQMFFQWVVQNPDKAKKALIQWKNTESGCGK